MRELLRSMKKENRIFAVRLNEFHTRLPVYLANYNPENVLLKT